MKIEMRAQAPKPTRESPRAPRQPKNPELDARRQVVRDAVTCPTCLVSPGHHCQRRPQRPFESLHNHASRWEYFELLFGYRP